MGEKKIMSWFFKKRTDDIKTLPSEMSPLEAVTHLCASIQLADGQADYEEREAWINTISELFPEFLEERADKFLTDAQTILNQKSGNDKMSYILQILTRIKILLTKEQIDLLGPKLSELIEADGIVMTSEMEILNLIESELGINIDVDKNL